MKTKKQFKVGDDVSWKWRGGYIFGEVVEVYFQPVVKVLKGKSIKRNGSPDKPAYLVKSEANNYALKLITELEEKNYNKS